MHAMCQLVIHENLAQPRCGRIPIAFIENDKEIRQAPENTRKHPFEAWIEFARHARHMDGPENLPAAAYLLIALEQPVDCRFAVDQVRELWQPEQADGVIIGMRSAIRDEYVIAVVDFFGGFAHPRIVSLAQK